MTHRRVLSIAGSDPSGGAGIQADLKTFSALGCYGMTAIVAVVDENTVGVTGVHPVPVEFVTGQIRSVLDDIGADAIKIGMLHSSPLIEGVARTLDIYGIRDIVIDPVMVATSDDPLLLPDAVATLRDTLMPMARVITPNLPEASILAGETVDSPEQFEEAARTLSRICGGVSVLLKGGHLYGDTLTDLLYDAGRDRTTRFTSARVPTRNTHGTGCTLSSALAAWLAQGYPLDMAVQQALEYVARAVSAGAGYEVGHGHGPVHHFCDWWK